MKLFLITLLIVGITAVAPTQTTAQTTAQATAQLPEGHTEGRAIQCEAPRPYHVIPAKTVVPTTPTLKNVLIEEFTGIYCTYCPGGHRIIAGIINALGNRMSAYCCHTGNLASPGADGPDFRTPQGALFFAMQGGAGMPSGNFHRQFFPTSIGGNAYNPPLAAWTRTVKKYIMNDTAPVNLLIEAEIDTTTRLLTVRVAGYFTGAGSQPLPGTALLNIVLTENFQIGIQSGQPDGDKYVHRHIFRDMITTSPWGDTLRNIQKGTSFDTTYTYVIPENYNNRKANLNNFEPIVFLTHPDRKNVLNSARCEPQVFPARPYEPPYAHLTLQNIGSSYGSNYFTFEVLNLGSDTITTLSISTTINSVQQPITVNNLNIVSKTAQSIIVPLDNYTKRNTNIYRFLTSSINDVPFVSNSINGSFTQPIVIQADTGAITAKLLVYFTPDTAMGLDGENSYVVRDANGTIILERTFNITAGTFCDTVEVSKNLVYQFELSDTWDDNMASGGYSLSLLFSDGTSENITTGGAEVLPFSWTTTAPPTAIERHQPTAKFSAHSKNGNIYISNPSGSFVKSVEVIDMLGRVVEKHHVNHSKNIEFSTNTNKSVVILRITGNSSSSQKIKLFL
ncbi:MAG: Omp28-related outer membrane protein [Bacteroidales bacterium]|jgi:hypothetical protein|nr:Omp28-related outer membrane protein [Bacteroidales bacterium]